MSSSVPRHAFTADIERILSRHFGEIAGDVLQLSPLLGYLNHKTKSANRGSKSRGAFANHYALYVLVADYISKGFGPGGKRAGAYDSYDGARFTDLLNRARELPFGQKLQNHALNNRLNDEFRKFYPTLEKVPIVRDLGKRRYWIQEDLLTVTVRGKRGRKHELNIAQAVVEIIDAYVAAKKEAFELFIESCRKIAALAESDVDSATSFMEAQLRPEVDARVFEIVSFAVLKAFYGDQQIFWGWSADTITEEHLTLYKTGRTNANDGGIDFVMRPLGRFFQVTETIDVNKYFLDIDKIQRFPLTFVVKSNASIDEIKAVIEDQARTKYRITAVVQSYMNAIEEIINIPKLLECLQTVITAGRIALVMKEVVLQSRVEFNYPEEAETKPDETE
jgi:hypothetical protein